MNPANAGARIAIDLDDVLADLIGELLHLYCKRHGVDMRREDVVDWDTFPEDVHNAIRKDGGYESLSPIPGADEFLAWLAVRYETHIVTYRSPAAREETTRWLQAHMPQVYQDVHFADGSKVSICRSLGVELLIDDSVNQLPPVTKELGIPGILIDTPMNRRIRQSSRIKRAYNFTEAREHVCGMLGRG